MTISERIKRFRKERGFTQKELGMLINKSSQVISNWERGYTTTINHDDITNLSRILKKPIEEIVGSDFKEHSPVPHEFISPEDLELLKQIKNLSLSPEDIELLKQIKKFPSEKRQALEWILRANEEAATITKKNA